VVLPDSSQSPKTGQKISETPALTQYSVRDEITNIPN
jgi:hypothetical protein